VSSSEVDTAVLQILNDSPLNVWDGDVGDSDPTDMIITAELPYVVFYSTPGYPNEASRRVGGVVRGRAVEFQINGAGETREQAKWALERAEELLDGAVIDVGGRKRRIRRTDDNLFVRKDPTWTRPGGEPLFFGVSRFVTTTTR
jgi:hypothetical protein